MHIKAKWAWPPFCKIRAVWWSWTFLSRDGMRGCGNPGGAAIVGSASPSEGLAVKTRPGSYSVRVLECADVGVGGGGRKREGAGGW